MLHPLSLTLHVVAATIWVGGMFFAYQVLRPAAVDLPPPSRLQLWAGTFARFFRWVWLCIVVLLISGYWIVFNHFGSVASASLYIQLMQVFGFLMMGIFLYVYFVLYKQLKIALTRGDISEAANHLARIRRQVGINLILGLVTVATVSGGRVT